MVLKLYTKVLIVQMTVIILILALLVFVKFVDSNSFDKLAVEYKKIARFDINTSLVTEGK